MRRPSSAQLAWTRKRHDRRAVPRPCAEGGTPVLEKGVKLKPKHLPLVALGVRAVSVASRWSRRKRSSCRSTPLARTAMTGPGPYLTAALAATGYVQASVRTVGDNPAHFADARREVARTPSSPPATSRKSGTTTRTRLASRCGPAGPASLRGCVPRSPARRTQGEHRDLCAPESERGGVVCAGARHSLSPRIALPCARGASPRPAPPPQEARPTCCTVCRPGSFLRALP